VLEKKEISEVKKECDKKSVIKSALTRCRHIQKEWD